MLYYLPGPNFAAGANLSDSVDCSGNPILRIITPSGWTAAPLTFQLSPDNVTWNDMMHLAFTPSFIGAKDAAGYLPLEVTVPMIIPNAIYAMPPNTGAGIGLIRFRSGSSRWPIVQQLDRTFRIVLDVPAS